MRRQQRIQEIAQQIQRLQQQLAAASSNPRNLPYKIVSDSKDFELEMTDGVAVRRLNPPFAYDDKGFPIEYSKEKLAEMKGKDKDKPGYEAKVEDLASGQVIAVALKPPAKKTPSPSDPNGKPTEPKDPKDPKDPKVKEDTPPPEVARPTATLVLILRDATDPLAKSDQPTKKKKEK